MRVQDVLTVNVISCRPETDMGTAAKMMSVGGLGHLAGILSIDDIALRAAGPDGGVAPEAFVRAMQRLSARTLDDGEPEVGDGMAGG